jgi:glycosyltransferase involved in cell wall biosynthesis
MKERLLYISPDETSFTRKDIDFLSKRYEVLKIQQKWSIKGRIIFNFLRQFFFLLRVMPKSAATIVMFGGYWAFLPALLGKVFKKPVFIILGGADCVSFPAYNYGSLRKPFLKKIIYWSYALCDKLLPVDESLVITEYEYDSSVLSKKQGYLYYFPGLTTPYEVINNGFDAEYWQSADVPKNPLVFTTIAKVADQSRFSVKGIDLVIKIAEVFPAYRFNIIGMDITFAKSLGQLPGNIIIHDFLNLKEIKALLAESQYYLQLSVSEGFPNALCEAMLCKCIPICSKTGGMPYIVKDTGVLIERKELDLIVRKISEIINMSSEEIISLGEKARINIKNRFPIEKREKAFFELLDSTAR